MSGFGLRAFKRLKEESHQKNMKVSYLQHLVYGGSEYAVLTYLKLRQRHGADKVGIICKDPISKQDVIKQHRVCVHTVRNETCAERLKIECPQLELVKESASVQFYKDGKLHAVDGRAKPYAFLEDEDFFQNQFYHLRKENLFDQNDWENLDEILEATQINKYIQKIEKLTPNDLVNPVNFRLSTGEHENFECEKLYWCDSPKSFYRLVSNKNELSDASGAYISALEQRIGLNVRFECEGRVSEERGTLLIPQSLTHEWGYFVVDVEAYDESLNQQALRTMLLIEGDEVTEEELAKKIKLLKRSLARVLPEFEKADMQEHIFYNDTILIKNCQDELYYQPENQEIDKLFFVGLGAPLKSSCSPECRYDARAILSYQQI